MALVEKNINSFKSDVAKTIMCITDGDLSSDA